MAERYTDPTLLLAEYALLEWPALAETVGPDEQGWEAVKTRGTDHVLRWHVSERLGLPLKPFTVWWRQPNGPDGETGVQRSQANGRTMLTFAEPLVRVVLDLITGGGTGVAMAFGPGPAEVALLLDAASGGDGDSVVLHGPAVQRVVVIGADVGSWRVETLAAAVADRSWKPGELVGLPAESGESSYEPEPQGIIGTEVGGREAAVQRLQRAAPPMGWPAISPSGRAAPPWAPVDPEPFVEELHEELLAGLLRAYDGRPPHEQARYVRREAIDGPRTATGVARQPSAVSLPVLAAALLAAEIDLPVALALGLATGYATRPEDGHQRPIDLMVSAEYPWVPGLGGGAEVASVAPGPPLPGPQPGAPSAVRSRHNGAMAPSTAGRPWTTVISTSWDRVRPSLTLSRPVAAAHGRFDPTGTDPLVSLLEDRPSGGPRPLAITPLADRPDRVGVADRGVQLPRDSTAGSSGHAVSVCDAFGVWSPWRETGTDLPRMPIPVPLPTNPVAEAVYAGSPICATTVGVDVIVDESATPVSFVQVRGWLLPAPYSGAPPPPGLGPGTTQPPAGSVPLWALLRNAGDGLVPSVAASFELEELAEDGGNEPLPTPRGPRRRWRLRLPAIALDYSAAPHWTLAVWARELAAADWSADAGPAVTSVSSPVPPVVTVLRPPVPPLGSAADAEGRSHVEVPLPVVPGATRLIVWTLAETTLVPGALTSPLGQPPPALAERYATLRGAVGTDGSTRRRFTRLREVAPGAPAIDVALPRGSREIHLFAVTAVNPADIESDWPAGAGAMWAAVAPELVSPGPPVVTAVVEPSGDLSVTVSSRSRLPVAEMRLYATRTWDVARDVASMGTFLPLPAPTRQPDPPAAAPHPAGDSWRSTAVLGRAQVEGWRGLYLRALAHPVASAPDQGLLGADSVPSEVVTVTVPPAGAPDLSVPVGDTWGEPPDGVVVRFHAICPLVPSPWGPHTLAVRSTAGADALFDLPAIAVGSIPVDPDEPGPTTTLPLLVRTGPLAAGRLPLALWFRRPDMAVAVDATVAFGDPLGGVSIRRLTVPPVSVATPPDVSIVSAEIANPMCIVDFETAAPVVPVPEGVWQITITLFSAGMIGSFVTELNVIDIPLFTGGWPSSGGLDVGRFPGEGHRHSYRARLINPYIDRVIVEVRAPDGSSAVDQREVWTNG